jgi:hypothetical protein
MVVDPNPWDGRIDSIVKYGSLVTLLMQFLIFAKK